MLVLSENDDEQLLVKASLNPDIRESDADVMGCVE